MTRIKALLSTLFGALALFGIQCVAVAGPLDPAQCLSPAINLSAFNFSAINGGGQTYCQSGFGWSDTWFPTGQPTSYDPHLDVLSGDNAPTAFYFDLQGVMHGSGVQTVNGVASANYNFISPFLDGGNLSASIIGSDWALNPGQPGCSASGDIAPGTLAGTGTSCLTLGGLDLQITTTVGANGMTETFNFTNNTGGVINALYLDDYFNFHANGSAGAGDTDCPTTSFNGTTVTTVGSATPVNGHPCAPIVQTGTMFGSFTVGGAPVVPTAWDLGLAFGVLGDMALGPASFNMANGPCTGDCAADLVWALGGLDIGQSVSFTVDKTARVPEPASLGLFGLGLLALGFFRRRS